MEKGKVTAAVGDKNQPPDYLNCDLPLAHRVRDLVSRMSLEEKVSQMRDQAPAIERLGVPAYSWWNECLHGVARAGLATVFPQAIGLASTWNPELVHEVATAISDEARAKYNIAVRKGSLGRYHGLNFWSPTINIARDPRWGRGQETYGEDPFLTAQIAVAFVKGLQGEGEYLKTIATPKHFAVHSGPENARHHFDVRLDERDLRETYLCAFQACVQEGKAQSIMSAYNALTGIPCSANARLLQTVLREEWGFEGFVASDCGAIADIHRFHHFVATAAEAAAIAVLAGCDLCCGTDYDALVEAVREGLLPEPAIDQAVERLFKARFQLGMFDPPERVPYHQIPDKVVACARHRELAHEAALQSIVLLKNSRSFLPLNLNKIESIAIIGPNANRIQLGNYHGSPRARVTVYEAMQRRVGPSVALAWARGCAVTGPLEFVPVPSANLTPASATACTHGLRGEYYPNRELAGEPTRVRIDPQIDFEWEEGSPDRPGSGDRFSVRWTGKLLAPISGNCRFALTADDGLRFYFDGALLVDEWRPRNESTDVVTVELEAGRSYDMRIEYFNYLWHGSAQLEWDMLPADPFTEAVTLAQNADVAIFVTGMAEGEEGEPGDRTDLRLQGVQEDLLRAVAATGTPVVVVLIGGGAVSMADWQDEVTAILAAWYPGEQGGNAIAEVLLGDYNPAGRLPVTFYKSVAHLPPFTNYAMQGTTYRFLRHEPELPFGFGLSYTTFRYDNLRLSLAKITTTGESVASVEVTNTGDRAGDEVVQLYVSDGGNKVSRPIKSLRGFKRVTLAAGETQTVTFPITSQHLSSYDAKMRFCMQPGVYTIMIGASSAKYRSAVLEVTAE